MKKTYLAAALVAFASVMTVPAQAATVYSSFDVSVTLVSRSVANNSGTQTLGFGNYDALGSASNTDSVVLDFNCPRGLAAPTFAFDTANGSATGYGVLAGFNYRLVADNTVATSGGSAATAVEN